MLNRLTGSDVLVEDKLFATLDATVRRLPLPDGRRVVMTDTVGFVRKLPHGLVEAFTSTLEQSAEADLLLHVVDAAHPDAEAQIAAVQEVLEEIGADDVPQQLVFNKTDRIDPVALEALVRRVEGGLDVDVVRVSAQTGDGVDALIERIGERLPVDRYQVEAHIPYARQDLVAMAHRRGQVLDEEHDETGTRLVAELDEDVVLEMRDYLRDDPFAEPPEPWERVNH